MKIKKYLPGKKFKYLFISFLVIALVFFVAFKLLSNKNSFLASKNNSQIQAEKLTIDNLIQQDSDSDGVADWEENLWGTDPKNKSTFEGIPDVTYIKNKRADLKTDTTIQNGTLTETDKFARDFFASYSAMKTSGAVDANTFNNFSSALEQKVTDPSIIDKYLEKDIKLTKKDELTDQEDYYIAAGNLFETYKNKGVGSELETAGDMASTGNTGDNQNQNNLVKISEAYQEFAQKLILVPVPKSLVQYHLKIINSANNTGVAVLNMSKMITDPIVGISGISQYEKYSQDLINSVNDLESFLTTNGIISTDNTTP
jgi:hypothetical protein